MKKSQYLALALSLSLSACVNRVDTVASKYELKSQIPINASNIVIAYDFNPYSKSLQADSLFSQALVQDLEKWGRKRLHPVAPSGVAQIKVRQASISKVPNVKYPEALEGCLDVMLSIIDNNGVGHAYAEAKIKQHVSAPPNMTDKEMATLKKVLITKLVDGLDAEMESVLVAKANPSYVGRNIQPR
ncbi:MAG: hypothetical protein Q8S21_04260 [Candidatus Paracaedibacteraceae bacterium]|nr:hypothetical protein [Candidatus Paracaedibacteraceae bacterium]